MEDVLWSGELDNIAGITLNAANYIYNYRQKRKTTKFILDNYNQLENVISTVLGIWTGHTYVGERKQEKIKKAFQKFFVNFMDLLLDIKNYSENYALKEKQLSKKALFQGTVYRLLGHNTADKNEKIEQTFDDIYVSWSKIPQNSYFESKLYGVITWIKCIISVKYFGIDLTALQCSRSNEQEIVFPTIEECITEIKYIEER